MGNITAKEVCRRLLHADYMLKSRRTEKWDLEQRKKDLDEEARKKAKQVFNFNKMHEKLDLLKDQIEDVENRFQKWNWIDVNGDGDRSWELDIFDETKAREFGPLTDNLRETMYSLTHIEEEFEKIAASVMNRKSIITEINQQILSKKNQIASYGRKIKYYTDLLMTKVLDNELPVKKEDFVFIYKTAKEILGTLCYLAKMTEDGYPSRKMCNEEGKLCFTPIRNEDGSIDIEIIINHYFVKPIQCDCEYEDDVCDERMKLEISTEIEIEDFVFEIEKYFEGKFTVEIDYDEVEIEVDGDTFNFDSSIIILIKGGIKNAK